MIHLDLFSGIGGFALAVDEVWPEAEHVFCEIDPYCQALLKLRFKGAKIYGDIRELTTDTKSKRNLSKKQSRQRYGVEQKNTFTPDTADTRIERMQGRKNEIFLLTGGFPCQPFSQAGKRKGTSDNRFLWPEMFRVIREFQPAWVIAENVRGLLTIESGMVFEQVCFDLENEGYEVQPFIIPAVAVNAPQRRDRVWFVAYSVRTRLEREDRCRKESLEGSLPKKTKADIPEITGASNYAPDTQTTRLQRSNTEGRRRSDGRDTERFRQQNWNEPWYEVALRTCDGRMDDGLSAELDGLKLSKSRHRIERLKALGNAIVPQVAVEIMKAIRRSSDEL